MLIELNVLSNLQYKVWLIIETGFENLCDENSGCVLYQSFLDRNVKFWA